MYSQCGDDSHDKERAVELRSGHAECLFLVPESTSGKAHAKNKQDVAKDRSNQTGLHDGQLALEQGDDGDDKFDGVTERGVEQAAERLAYSNRDLFCAEREERSERDDSED